MGALAGLSTAARIKAGAIVVGIVSCHQGLQTIGGPRGIGRSVTKAVVNSIVLILILDYVLTRILLYFDL